MGRSASISVVMPCYNAASYLEQAIESVHRQSRAPVELIVVDDCSSDDSAAIARALGARCERTVVNSGPSAARNLGIELAGGELVAFLDADDYWEPPHLEIVAGLLDRHPDAILAFARERRIGEWEGTHGSALPADEPFDAFWRVLRSNPVPQMGVVVRRDDLLAVGGYVETMRLAEDYDLWLRLAVRRPFVASHAVTCNHRGHSEQASHDESRLARGAFEARYHALQALRRDGSPEAVARAEGVIREAWQAYLKRVWLRRDREMFDAALSLAPLVPGSAPMHRRWARRADLLWPLYIQAAHAWEHMPERMRRSLRDLLPF